ncbi:Stage VI sporulation protein D [compost metagenome]
MAEEWRDQEFTAAHDLSASDQREQYPGIEDAVSTSYAADEQQEVSSELSNSVLGQGQVIEDDIKANEGQDAWAVLAPSITEDETPDLPTAEAYISNFQSQPAPEQLKWDNSLITSTVTAEEVQQVSAQVPPEAVSASGDLDAINTEQDVPVFQAESESELADTEEATVSSSVEEVVQEEKPELKIALGSKKTSAQEAVSSFSISNLLPKHRSLVEPEVAEQVEVEAEPTLESDVEDRTSWKSLFIRQSEDQAPFRKMKLVIVQREETLNDIAERYHLSTRELQLYNRLEEHHLAEGQVLYIP